jgi:hypothetical protein
MMGQDICLWSFIPSVLKKVMITISLQWLEALAKTKKDKQNDSTSKLDKRNVQCYTYTWYIEKLKCD